MTKFFIQGNVTDACAGLKKTLDAQDANFKAQLNAVVKVAPPLQRVFSPLQAKATSPLKPPPGTGTLLGTNRSRRFGG